MGPNDSTDGRGWPGHPHPSWGHEERFGEVLAAYLEAVDAGWAPHRRSFVERYPQWRGDLETFFESHDEVHSLAEPFRTLSGTAIPPSPTGEPPTVVIEPGLGTLPRAFGDYELVEEIARGGMGVVYKARQGGLNRVVALKMILAGQLATKEEVRRFRNEAEAAALMSHPNIVPIYEVGEQSGQPFFSMKLIEGGNLAQHVEEFRDRPRAAAAFLVPVARAVHYAHQRGILHRDLKPANILLEGGGNAEGPEGAPQITDFGLAKRFHDEADLTQSSAILGTPCYMAPEQAQGKGGGLTTAADVYSLGAILYELLTGRPPFKAENALETLLQVRQQAPVPPRALNPKVDRDLETICLRCLEKVPGRRYGSAEALADDLERFLANEAIAARRVGAWERAWKWAWRRPARAVVSALVAVIAVLCLIGVGVLAQLRETHHAWQAEALRASAESEAHQKAESARADAEKARTEAESARQVAVVEKRRAEEALYAYRLAQTRLALFARKTGEADRLLDSCPPGLRAWEWHHLKRLCQTDALPVDTPAARMTSLALNLWDRVSATALPHPMGRPVPVPWAQLTFSPDGNSLAGNYRSDPMVHVWNVASGKPVLTAPRTGAPVQGMAYSRDGQRLVTAGGGRVQSWDAHSGQQLQRKGDVKGFTIAAFSPDGMRLAFTGVGGQSHPHSPGGPDQKLQVWNVRTRSSVRLPLGEVKKVRGMVFSADGRRLAGVCDEKAIRVWDVDAGRALVDLRGHAATVRCLAFSPDGGRLASASDDTTVKVWELKTGKLLLTLKGHAQPVHGVTFSPDGMRLASGSADRTVRVWDAKTGLEVLPLAGHNSAVLNVAFSPDGQKLASVSDDRTIKVWDASRVAPGRKDKK